MPLSRKVISPSHMATWLKSEAYADIVSFIEAVNIQVRSKPVFEANIGSTASNSVVDMLVLLRNSVDTFPLDEQPQRFGNKAFRCWYAWICENKNNFCRKMLCDFEIIDDDLDQISTYLTESFGNSVRIDYGTGHELSFLAFLVTLFKIKFLKMSEKAIKESDNILQNHITDLASIGLLILPEYLRLVRHLQIYFKMEPAGSHGVWSLDDFQFVPYIWGSSQLIDNGTYEPSCIVNREIAMKEQDKYLFFSCIAYIHKLKTGPFAEHSPTLQGISNVPYWEKINSGMIKMYKGEVLNKFPLVQHFLFGTLLSFDAAPNNPRQKPIPTSSGEFQRPRPVPSFGDPDLI